MAKSKNTDVEEVLKSEDVMAAALKEKPEEHLNFIKPVYYRVSTGSLMWDVQTNGGLPPGLHRFIGPPESGKSSAALEVCRNFLLEHKNGRGVYIKAEGRLSEEMKARCGLKFTENPAEWVDGTIFVLDSNRYEFVINTISKLLNNPDNKSLFCFIIDSMDGLMSNVDANKEFEENVKVAGQALLTKKFLQRMANGMSKRGHLCLMLGQFTTKIQIDAYASAENKGSQQGGGGWGAAHFANFVFKFGDSFAGEILLANDSERPSPKNPPLGKRVKLKFIKTTNETSGIEVSYPVRFGVKGGSSVWTARELTDTMQMFSIIKKAAWIPRPESLAAALETATAIEWPEKIHGEAKLVAWLESEPKAIEFLKEHFRQTLINKPVANADTNEAEEAKF